MAAGGDSPGSPGDAPGTPGEAPAAAGDSPGITGEAPSLGGGPPSPDGTPGRMSTLVVDPSTSIQRRASSRTAACRRPTDAVTGVPSRAWSVSIWTTCDPG